VVNVDPARARINYFRLSSTATHRKIEVTIDEGCLREMDTKRNGIGHDGDHSI
jgi:hypothetical protein